MAKAQIILAFGAICLAAQASAGPAPSPSLPSPVSALVDRIEGCNHWQGEEPYDAARAKEIRNAIRELKCSALSKDEARILKRYGADPAVQQAIAKARDTVL